MKLVPIPIANSTLNVNSSLENGYKVLPKNSQKVKEDYIRKATRNLIYHYVLPPLAGKTRKRRDISGYHCTSSAYSSSQKWEATQ